MNSSKINYKVANGDEIREARSFVSAKYYQAGYLSNIQSKKPYSDKYVKHSTYIIAEDHEKIVGVIRVVSNSGIGLPVINQFNIDESFISRISRIEKGKIVEVGNLACEKGTGVALSLYKKALTHSFVMGHRYWVAGVDKDFLAGLRKKYRVITLIYKVIGKPKFYIGSETVPIIIPLWPLLFYSLFVRKDSLYEKK